MILDVEDEILCRVPAISLNRLRSTCKRWNNLFRESKFTRKNLEKAAKQFLVLMLKDSRVCSISVNLHATRPSAKVTRELSLVDPRYNDQLVISQVFHCDGLLLGTDDDESIIVVWNPLTGQTKWFQTSDGDKTNTYYALGSYQDNKSGNKSYKVLSYGYDQAFEIYDLNADSWRTLDAATPDYQFPYSDCCTSLNGNTYWPIALQEEEKQEPCIFLVRFDYTREKFERLKGQIPIYMDDQIVALSVVRGEKLALLLKPEKSSKTEIWLTNKIDETKEISWSKVLAVDFSPYLQDSYGLSFLFDEEKKVLVCCDNDDDCEHIMVYIVGGDNRVTRDNFGEEDDATPFLFYYVPSLTRI
ncbi:hypothetical protein CARUB_v10022198mg [Capsella rubella]|uniref:F-box domain-containing protein n=1 Tax=Capsella rubella TaxID=81985 RepID=R0I960_9BRAS|nr:probable F-box protein At5g47300 [Capsella rubella]EOA34635.1 hypothetical protein CARUB_v10022198mg [Capsella rubella]